MQISEIRCHHKGCPKRKFFDSLPIEHIFIYATPGPTHVVYAATGYCIFSENCDMTPSSVEKEFLKITENIEPIHVFRMRPSPKYLKSLNALAFKYEVKTENREDLELILSFYLALRRKCQIEHKTITEIKVLPENNEKTEEVAFLSELPADFVKVAMKKLENVGVYEGIRSTMNVTEEYAEEKTPNNTLLRLKEWKFSDSVQNKQRQDLLLFFKVFMPEHYPSQLQEKETESIKPKKEEDALEERYKDIRYRLKKSENKAITQGKQDKYLDMTVNVEMHHHFYQLDLKAYERDHSNKDSRSNLSNSLRNINRALEEVEIFLKEMEE